MDVAQKILSFRFAFFLAISLSTVTFMTIWSLTHTPTTDNKTQPEYNVSMLIQEYDETSYLQKGMIVVTDKNGVGVPDLTVGYRKRLDNSSFQYQKTNAKGEIRLEILLGEYKIVIGETTYMAHFTHTP